MASILCDKKNKATKQLAGVSSVKTFRDNLQTYVI